MLNPEGARRSLDRRRGVAVVLKDAEHIERIVHVSIGKWIRPMVRIQALLTLIFDHIHARQASGTLRCEPLPPALDVSISLQQTLDVRPAVEDVDH